MPASATTQLPQHRRTGGSRPTPQARPAFRPDVQGLRALAVSLVVVYHLYPSLVPGGYVGVDVFFAISGFLITGHLLRTYERTGRVGFLEFYGRRARRLMPAAALVLLVTWLVSRVVLPASELPDLARQIRASALYFQNWQLSHDSVGYLNENKPPTPVQHFWSLSVEEQFYLFWPLLFLLAAGAAWLLRRAGRGRDSARFAGRGLLVVLAVTVVVASLWYSVTETRANAPVAYFVTTTRVWDLAAGGLLALLASKVTRRVGRVGVLAWAGLALIVVSAFTLDAASPFPGWVAALPVGGAVLALASGSREARLSPGRITSLRPVVFVGDISYSIYLWHWPLIVLWKAHSGGHIGLVDGPAIVAASVLLAWLTKILVEDPIRLAPFVARSRVRSLATVLTVAVPVALVALYIAHEPPPFKGRIDQKHPGAGVLAAHVPAAATAPGTPSAASSAPVAPPKPAHIEPPLTQAANDLELASTGTCQVEQLHVKPIVCVFGDKTAPVKTVGLVGDSHAGQWSTALDQIGKKLHWKIVVMTHNSCEWTATMVVQDGHTSPFTTCHTWGVKVLQMLLAMKPDAVITTSRGNVGTPQHPAVDRISRAQIAAGMDAYWKRLLAAGIKVVVIKETPEMGRDIPECLSTPGNKPKDCTTPYAQAVPAHTPLKLAAQHLPQVSFIDMNPYICMPPTCQPIVGNIIVWRDQQHLSNTYSRSLVPFLQAKLLATAALRG